MATPSQVLFIEGQFGAGKTTLSQRVGRDLAALGLDVQVHHEWGPDHPIPLDPHRIAQHICDPNLLAKVQHRFETARLTGVDLVILESRLWQYAAMYPLLADVPRPQIHALLQRIYAAMQGHTPRLVVFEHTDPDAAFQTTMADPARAEWLQWVSRLAEGLPWLQNRGLAGVGGWRQFVGAWARFRGELCGDVPFGMLRLLDSENDWAGAHRAVDEFLGLPGR